MEERGLYIVVAYEVFMSSLLSYFSAISTLKAFNASGDFNVTKMRKNAAIMPPVRGPKI